MAARTKSFFEQRHGHNPRFGCSNGSKRTVLGDSNSNVPLAAPAIPATSEAKSKLEAFQFAPNTTDGQLEPSDPTNKENYTSSNGQDRQFVMSPSHASMATNTPSLAHPNQFPCTPSTRLPLEDLIGNSDEASKGILPAEESPEEQICWNQETSAKIQKTSAITPNANRKRARSSSPSCPSTSSRSVKAPRLLAVDQALAKRATREADPVAELWERYVNEKQDGENFNLADIGDLSVHRSPGLFETPIKNGPLRRWASTANEWPSSKSKRKCMNTRTSVELWREHATDDRHGKSKVAAMVQKVQDSLATHKFEQAPPEAIVEKVDGQSSSSPLPISHQEPAANAVPVSPLYARQRPVIANSDRPLVHADGRPAVARSHSANASSLRPDLNGNPYGLSSRVHSEEDTTVSAPLYLRSKAPLPAYKRPSITRRPSPPKGSQQNVVPATIEDLDEFGDAFELTSADLNEIMPEVELYQRPLHDIPPHPNPPLQLNLADEDTNLHTVVDGLSFHETDEFGGDDIDDECFAEAEFSATQALRSEPKTESPKVKLNPSNCAVKLPPAQGRPEDEGTKPASHLQRYRVKQVIDGEYTDPNGRRRGEKLLLAEQERTAQTTAISLRGTWTTTPAALDDIVHIAHLAHQSSGLGSDPIGQIMVTDDAHSPLIIVHPDHMLSATTVADSFDCVRKAVLQDRIKATGETSKPMVYGKILHQIFQHALASNQWDAGFLAHLVESTVANHVEGLWELGMRDTNLAVEEIQSKMAELAGWARIFVAAEPSEVSLADDRNGEKVAVSVSKLIAIEEHIWSPRYGLKGNIDATVQTTLSQPAEKLIAPFEVKTGRTTNSPAHRAQTALYTLLLSDRYDLPVSAGILYYLESAALARIAPPVNEIRQMVQQRNRLAAYIFAARHPGRRERNPLSQEMESSNLPEMLKNPFKCGRCYAQQSCFTYHALMEDGSAQTAGMVDDKGKYHSLLWQEAIGHLHLGPRNLPQSDVLKQWFSKWDRLLSFEDREQSKLRKELWTMSSNERQEVGRCFGRLVLARDLTSTAPPASTNVLDGIEGSGGKINRFAYVFVRAEAKGGGSFTDGSQLTVGEPIVVSSEQGQWALANGYVVAVNKHEITVAVDRKLGNARRRLAGFHVEHNQALEGIMTVGGGRENASPSDTEETLYRLDKDEFSNGLALIRNNLVSLMSSHPIHTKLRNQIVFGQGPTFTPTSSPETPFITKSGEMNDDQRAAVAKVMSAQDYALILGMPGTGKTTTIAHIISALLEQDQSILLTSFTHTAVDNILLKIRDIAPAGSILRLGVPAKINQQVQEFCQLAATPRKTIDEIEAAYMGSKIVATTCMGMNHALFHRRRFDVCIVDEASQITLPTNLGPLLHARKFVLVGDHYQLPPLVQNKAALDGGFDVSLFRQLSEEHPEAVASLGFQYRMSEDIMSLSNTLVYEGKLRCGSEAVAQRMLPHPDPAAWKHFHSSTTSCQEGDACWLWRATNPVEKVVFANIDPMGKAALETLSSGKNIHNLVEATLSTQLVLSLLALGIPGRDIGVMTLYRSQLTLIRQLFRRARISHEVEIDSADRFQGRDKECIILSMVRCNEVGIVGELLKDWRRVNVALTRARSKLIVLGSRRTLQNNDVLAKFLSLVTAQQWCFDLPPAADEQHGFNFSSQTAGVPTSSSVQPPKDGRTPSCSQQSPVSRSPLRERKNPPGSAKKSSASKQKLDTGKEIHPKVIHGIGDSKRLKRVKEQIAIEILEDD